ncbi:MAG: dipeptidyl aminopeptidase/acylaminoacyl peptidase [Candidatus Midichloriaceae bacterium]|jgi:dipeptidyl aminopeptidase/acylaminoacyl peptidase
MYVIKYGCVLFYCSSNLYMNSDNLIQREVIFGNPDRANIQISKDGKNISYLSSKDGVLNIFVAKSDDISNAKSITDDKGRGIRSYFWSYDNQHILYLKDKDGDENERIHRVNIDTKSDEILTPKEGVKTLIYKISHKFPEEIIIGLNERRKEYFDLYKLNILTGNMLLLYKNDKYLAFNIDNDYNIKFGYFPTPDGGNQIHQFEGGKEVEFMKIPYEDVNTSGICGFNEKGDAAYFVSSIDRDTSALYLMDLHSQKKELIYSNTKADISDIILQPESSELQAVSYYYDKQDYHILDEEFKADFDYLKKLHTSASITLSSRTLKDDKWLTSFIFDNESVKYYLYDRSIKKEQYLFSNREKLDEYHLSKMHPVVIKSRDGLEMMSYISLPNNQLKSENGYKTNKPMPMVLYVHGGPNARDYWGLDATHQWLTNRGYAVLSVNYRGSTGFGKNFINAGEGEWGAKMHDDLIDAVNWAVKEGVADKDKVAIMGGSYGGYAALVGLTFTPDVFACGIDIVGPSNLITLINSFPEYWKPFIKNMKLKVGGDPETEEGREILKKKSPLFYADKIIKPLLIAQGANDPRVKQAESDQMVDVLKSHNIPVIYALYPNEGHGFARPENRFSFFAIAEEFLAKYLGGRHEEIKDEMKNSSVQIKSGKEYLN